MPIDADAYPLYWPEHWPRTKRRETTYRYKLTFAAARDAAIKQLKKLRATEIIISTNIPVRRDGLPRADIQPTDPGVAVYWTEFATSGSTPRVIACDKWSTVRDNMRACGLALEALGALKRSGATQVVERAFGGIAALPMNASRPWRDAMGFSHTDPVSRETLTARYHELLLKAHPDHGGTQSALTALINAYRDARDEMIG